MALGVLWLLDAVLQSQAAMFRPDFFGMLMAMGPSAPPGWLYDWWTHIEPFVTSHSVAVNAACVAVQAGVGLGMLWRRTLRLALAGSALWAVVVWLFGEAAGGVFVVGANALTGAPGAALLYAVAALLLWPAAPDDGDSVAAGGPGGAAVGLGVWVALWLGTAALEAQAINRLPLYAGGEISNAANGATGFLLAVHHVVGRAVAGHGAAFAAASGAAQAAVGLAVLRDRWRRPALAAGSALALTYGVFGQDVGGVFDAGWRVLSSGATDPGTAPLLLLLAATLWPRPDRESRPQAVSNRAFSARPNGSEPVAATASLNETRSPLFSSTQRSRSLSSSRAPVR